MKFSYKALRDSKIIKGTIEADNKQKVIEHLKARNYIIIDISEHASGIGQYLNVALSKVTFTDVVDLTRQLAIMFNAGLTIIESLDILKKQLAKPALIKLINQIDEEVRAGNSLSHALQRRRDLFDNLYISLVKAGEASGKLDEILLKLADNLEKQREFRGKIRGALIYPAIVIIGMVSVMFIMITFVVPKLLNLYKDFDIDLPITTQILIAVSGFFQQYWIILLVGVFGISFVLKRYFKTKTGRTTKDKIMLRIPIIKRVVEVSALVDTTRTLSILIGAGVSILDGLDIVVETSNNVVFQDAFAKIHNKIEKGQSFGKSLDEAGIFPPILVQMSTVGEQTGHLDDTLLRMSNYFEMESEMAVKAMTTLIEPTILIFLGLGVGFLVLSVITPIYNLTNSFK